MKLETARNLSLVRRRALNKTSSVSVVKPTRCMNVSNLFYWSNTLHVSDGLSVHHQEFKTVHTATGIRQRDTADCLLAIFALLQTQVTLRLNFLSRTIASSLLQTEHYCQ